MRQIQSGPSGECASAVDFDIQNLPHDYFDDPSRYFRLLRHHDPIHRNADGSVLITRYDDVQTVWRDVTAVVGKEDFFRKRMGEGPLLEHFTKSIVYLDPPEHDILRAKINPFFSARSLKLHKPMIEAAIDELIDELAARERVDFVKEFASVLPTRVICRVIGFPEVDGEFIHDIAQRQLQALNFNVPAEQMPDANLASQQFEDYTLRILNERRADPDLDPDRDMLSAIVAAERAGDGLSEADIIHTAMVIFNGGHGTTMHMLAGSLHFLLQEPDLIEELRADPEAAGTAFQELVRFISPVQVHWRRTTKEIVLPSGTLPPQTEVMMCGGSANRDETVFENPDRIVLRRNPNKHIGFGTGIHFCLGAGLARMEVASALPKIFTRFASIERTGEASFKPLLKFRALKSLPLAFR